MLYGKCNNPYGHGHDYILHISVAGEPDPRTGRLVNVGALDRYVQQRVLGVYDHSDLNHDVADFRAYRQPKIWQSRATADCAAWPFANAVLDRVLIQETGRNTVELRKAKCRAMRKATVKVMKSQAPVTEPQEEGRISELMREVLVELGEDPDREGLIRTPCAPRRP